MTYYLKCFMCGVELPESYIQESHDVPCYLFEGQFRNIRKNQADKFGRHHLCDAHGKNCHKIYEDSLRKVLQQKAKEFSLKYFKKEGDNDTKSA